jgi:hypothetical protein
MNLLATLTDRIWCTSWNSTKGPDMRLCWTTLRVSVVALVLLAGQWICTAQTAATGALAGIVTDQTGAVVPNVSIVLVNDATGETRSAASQSNGAFAFLLLAPGPYHVEASKEGFKKATRAGIRVNVAETTKFDVQLEVGTLQQTVIVSGAPAMAQTESSALGRVVGEQVVSNLPLVTRNYTQIIALSPGISTNVTNATELGRGSGGQTSETEGEGVFVHGARQYDNNFQMDGIEINDIEGSGGESGGIAIPNPDTIEEFKVQTGQYDAGFGRGAGANVNILTKGGSNQFHGTVFEFFRNELLNANDFFFNQTNQKKPALRQNQFGFTLGGPIRKDKLLFFGSYQGTRQLNGVATATTAYTTGSVGGCRTSNFSPPLSDDRSRAALGALFAGQAGALGGAVVLPDGSNINPIALTLLQMKLPGGGFLIPTPQVIDPTKPFASQGFSVLSIPCTFNEDQFMINADYLQTAKSKFSGRFFSSSSNQHTSFPQSSTVNGFPRITDNAFRNFSLAQTYVINSQMFNEARLGFHRSVTNFKAQAPFNWSGIGVTPAAPQDNDLPNISILGSFQISGGYPFDFVQNTYDFLDSFSYIHGRHTLRIGGGITRAQANFLHYRNNDQLIFLSFPDFLLGLDGVSNGTGLFSNVFGSVSFYGLFDRAYRVWDGSGYAQDGFKVSPRFTLNLGLRYERIGDFADALGRNTGFWPSLANSNPPPQGSLQGFVVPSNFSGGSVPAGVTQLGHEYAVNGDGQNTWAPRLGFSWQVLPSSQRLVVRGGYGIFYSRVTGQSSFVQTAFSRPFANLTVDVAEANAGATFANPFPPNVPLSGFPVWVPYSPATALSLSTLAPNYRPSITQQYSLNLQTEMAHDLLLEVGYVGTRGTHLFRARSANQALFANPASPIRGVTTNTLDNIGQRVPYPGFPANGITLLESEGTSWYNGLETSLTKRLGHGVQFLASYTFSKILDTDGANLVVVSGGTQTWGDQNNPRQRYGRASFDRPHRLVLSYVYDLPGPRNRQGLIFKVLGGWSISGVTTFQSGSALTIVDTNPNNAFGISNDRPDLASGCTPNQVLAPGPVTAKLNNYFKAACLANPTAIGADGLATGFGNIGVGTVNGPDQRNFDIALVKKTSIKERYNIEFRSEFFNAFNTPQFANPVTDFASPAFGQISSTAVNPRIVQLALKLTF